MKLRLRAARFGLALVVLALALPLLVPFAAAAERQVLVAAIRGPIQPVAAAFLKDAIAEAERSGAALLVVELDTPGGLVTSTREMTQAILGSRTPIAVYVSPAGAQAASAGFFLLISADVTAMAPGTNTGASATVGPEGQDLPATMKAKAEEDGAANIRALAQERGRNPELAAEAVIKARAWSAEEARTAGFVDLVAGDLPALLAALDGRVVKRPGGAEVKLETAGATQRRLEPTRLQRFLAALAHPNVAMILLSLGTAGLLVELYNPGAVLPGVAGAICLVLAFFALSILPVDYAGIALLALAGLFFIAEIKVASYGLLSVAGAGCLVLGWLMLFKDVGPAFGPSLALVVGLALMITTVAAFLSWTALRARKAPVTTGREAMVGLVGEARTHLAPEGKVFVRGELWNARAAEPVAPGEEVVVTEVQGLQLTVRPRYR